MSDGVAIREIRYEEPPVTRSSAPPDRVESERDQIDGPFTSVLRALFRASDAVIAAVLVDSDGEAVDYCSVLDPYEAKVAGAMLGLAFDRVVEFAAALDIGGAGFLEIRGAERDLVLRDLGEGYRLVVITEAGGSDPPLAEAVDIVCELLREEGGLPAPCWDPRAPRMRVEVREAVGWQFAPASLAVGPDEDPVPIRAVLGRWEERSSLAGGRLICFRVRLADGRETTLAFDEDEQTWMHW